MSLGRGLRLGLLALLLALLGVGQVVAQDANSTITGAVADEQGQVLPGATVTVINEATKLSRTAVSDSRGDFKFPTLIPGTYTVKVEMAGFKTFERRSNVLSTSATMSLGQLKLGLGPLSEVVIVEASGSQVNVEETQHAGLLTSTQISQLQSKGRDIANLLRAIPGVRYGDDTDALGDSFGTDVPNISGQRQHWTRATLDGMNASESGGGNKIGSAISLDAVAEVTVLLNTYRAEFGGSGGSQIKMISKSGTSDYKGTAYWLGRRTGWNANRWENNKAAVERPVYDYNTFGFNIGGPVPTGKEKKLFFFYNLELPNVHRSGALLKYRMPTAAERTGDFSGTYAQGSTTNKVSVIDPLTGVAFPGNIVPASRINPDFQKLMNLYPLPNAVDPTNQFNYQNQGDFSNPRQNHTLRLDWKPTSKDTVYISGVIQQSLQKGVDVPAAPAKWGFYSPTYNFGNAVVNLGNTHIFSSSLLNEASVGARNQWETFGFETPADQARVTRAGTGFAGASFFPDNNTKDLIPVVNVANMNPTGVTAPNFSYPNRIGEKANDYLISASDNLTWTKSDHTFKAGAIFERWYQNEAKAKNIGVYTFNNSSSNPVSTRVPYANFLMGAFSSYTESPQIVDTENRQSHLEWYVQDTWKATRRLTLDLGMRFLWYQQMHQAINGIPHAAFVPNRYVLGASPRIYLDNGASKAVDPGNPKDVRDSFWVGRFVPSSGDAGNGMVLSNDKSYPSGYRDNQGIHPEPKVGLAYDLFGNGKTNLHAGFSLSHNGIMGGGYQGNLRGAPSYYTLEISNSLATQAFLSGGGAQGPTSVGGLQRDDKTPSAYSMTFGVMQGLGWGTTIDVSYVGVLNRHMDAVVNINRIPDGAKCQGTTSAPCAPQAVVQTDVRAISTVNPVTGKLASDVNLRPYPGFSDIGIHQHWATGNYNALQAQLTRRYTKGLQFSIAYTFSKALGIGDNDPGDNGETVTMSRFATGQYYGPLSHNQAHNIVGNFTYDFPKGSSLLGKSLPVRLLLDNWQISGEIVHASGDWAQVSLDMNPNVDFTGGSNCSDLGCDGGATTIMLSNPRKKNGGFTQENPWFDVNAFAAPTTSNLGNTSRMVIQRPPIDSLNTSLFKNFPLGHGRRLQLRMEGYNVLNHTQIRDIGRTLQYAVPGGPLTNPTAAGTNATSTARPQRILQASVRFTF